MKGASISSSPTSRTTAPCTRRPKRLRRPACAVTLVTIWRAPLLLRAWGWTEGPKAAPIVPVRGRGRRFDAGLLAVDPENDLLNQPSMSWHMAAFTHTLYLVFEFPFVVMMFLTLWRFPIMWSRVLSARTSWRRYQYVVTHAYLMPQDVLSFLFLVLLTFTGWRARSVWRAIMAVVRPSPSSSSTSSSASAPSSADPKSSASSEAKRITPATAPSARAPPLDDGSATADPPNAWFNNKLWHTNTVHRAIMREAILFCGDVPLAVLWMVGIATVWRRRFINSELDKAGDVYFTRLRVVFVHAVLTVLDFAMWPSVVLLLLTWRHNKVKKLIRAQWEKMEIVPLYFGVFLNLIKLLIDLVVISLVPLLLWRIPSFVRIALSLKGQGKKLQLIQQYLRNLFLVVLDIISVALLLVTAVLGPWRLHWLWRDLVKTYQGKWGPRYELFNLATRRFFTMLRDWVLDVATLAFGVVSPWRLRYALSLLTMNPENPVGHRNQVDHIIRSIQDWLGIAAFIFVCVVAVWRAPMLIYTTLYIFFRKRSPEEARRGDTNGQMRTELLENVVWQFFALFLDLLQLLQLAYIILTLIQIPAYLMRTYDFLREGVKAARVSWSIYREEHRQAQLKARLAQQESKGTPGKLAPRIPSVVTRNVVMPFLDYRELCAMAAVNKEYSEEAAKERFWRPLFVKIGGKLPIGPAAAMMNSSKFQYKEKILAERRRRLNLPPPTPAERDWQLGYRHVLHLEFLESLSRLPHFLLLPFKFAGLLTLPVFIYSYLRYIRWAPQTTYRYFDEIPRECFREADRNLNFWRLQWFFVVNVFATLAIMLNESAILISLINVVFVSVATVIGPLWMNTVAGNRFGRDLINLVASLLLPIFIAFQLYLWFLPLGGFSSPAFQFVMRQVVWLANIVYSIVLWLCTTGPVARLFWWLLSFVPLQRLLPLWLAYGEPLWVHLLHGFDVAMNLTSANGINGHKVLEFVLEFVRTPIVWVTTGALTSTAGSALNATATAAVSLSGAASAVEAIAASPSSASAVIITYYTAFLRLLFGVFESLFRAEVWALDWLYAISLNWRFVSWPMWLLKWILTSRIVMFVIWTWMMAKAEFLTFTLINQYFPPYQPLWLYVLPFRIAWFQLRLLRRFLTFVLNQLKALLRWVLRLLNVIFEGIKFSYGRILDAATRFCRKIGFVGDILLIPISLAWMFWPLVIPTKYVLANTTLFIPAGMVSFALLLWGRIIVSDAWEGREFRFRFRAAILGQDLKRW